MATLAQAAEATGHDEAALVPVAVGLVDHGYIVTAAGSYLPTDTAVPALEAEAAQRYAAARTDTAVQDAADQFESINTGFLQSMSAWQLAKVGGTSVPNDHTDADYDEKVITRIERLVERLEPILAVFEEHDRRFAAYSKRFAAALDQVTRGKIDYVSLPTLDSVHNVWFEYHEDLLRTLGRERKE